MARRTQRISKPAASLADPRVADLFESIVEGWLDNDVVRRGSTSPAAPAWSPENIGERGDNDRLFGIHELVKARFEDLEHRLDHHEADHAADSARLGIVIMTGVGVVAILMTLWSQR